MWSTGWVALLDYLVSHHVHGITSSASSSLSLYFHNTTDYVGMSHHAGGWWTAPCANNADGHVTRHALEWSKRCPPSGPRRFVHIKLHCPCPAAKPSHTHHLVQVPNSPQPSGPRRFRALTVHSYCIVLVPLPNNPRTHTKMCTSTPTALTLFWFLPRADWFRLRRWLCECCCNGPGPALLEQAAPSKNRLIFEGRVASFGCCLLALTAGPQHLDGQLVSFA